MSDKPRAGPALVLGLAVSALGLLCLGAGIALLGWRILRPEDAALLRELYATPPATPTPGVLMAPVAPPPLPDDSVPVAILPVSEPPTPTRANPSATPSAARTATRAPTITRTPPASASATPSPTASATAPLATAPVSLTATPRPTPTSIASPALTLTPAATIPPAPTATSTVTITVTPSPTPVPAIPDRLIIDAIRLDAPIVPVGQHPLWIGGLVYSQWDVPNAYAVGWHQSSAPLGQLGNTVLNGHHNIYGEVFRWLVTLKPGDVIALESKGERTLYIVAQTMTLAEEGQPVETRQANARWILPTEDERVTLITCWPYDTNTHRLVVIALPLAELDRFADIP